ncbi:MAG: amino acid ABC transporter ATP-binding protein [Pseudomonadota bacterium]
MTAAPLPALAANQLSLAFGEHWAIDRVSLTIASGEVVALVGPSGCGKSSLLRCLTWLETPQRGTIAIDGEPFGRPVEGGSLQSRRTIDRMRPKIGMVFQDLNLWPHLSAIRNVVRPQCVVLGRSEAEARSRAETLLARLRVAEFAEKRPAQLSGGQRQRVAIARALAMDPALMLFDEPTSALDAELIGEVLALLKELAATGMTMLVVTHEIAFARHVADRLLFMDGGRIIAEGPPADIIERGNHPRVRAFFDTMLAFKSPD